MLQPGTTIGDRFQVDGRIGAGGMAEVYRLRHLTLGSHHALKLLSGGGPEIQRRLLHEGRAQGRLRHPHILSVSDVITINGAPGLILEYVAGPSLDVLLARRRLGVDEADLIARGVAEGLAAAHIAGLVHRDLKPANVLLAPGPGRVTPKVADFGLVKGGLDSGASVLTRAGATLGTPAYMAPEQIRDAASVTARADVWSLGALLYELLSGRRAFDGRDTFELYEQIAYGRFEPLQSLGLDLPDRMLRAVDGALQVQAADRWADAGELLEAWLGAPPSTAPGWPAALVEEIAALAPQVDEGPGPGRAGETYQSAPQTFQLAWSAGAEPIESSPSLATAEEASLVPAPADPGRAEAGNTILAVALAGVGGGLLATLGGAPGLWTQVVEAGLRTLSAPHAGLVVAGGLLSLAAPTLAGVIAARRSDQGAVAGAVVGLVGGLIFSAAIACPAAVLDAASIVKEGIHLGSPASDQEVGTLVARALIELFWRSTGAFGLSLAGFAFLGALGGALARLGIDRPSRALRPDEVVGAEFLGGALGLVSCLVLVATLGASRRLEEGLTSFGELPSFLAAASALPLLWTGPWLALAGVLMAWSSSRSLAWPELRWRRWTAGLYLATLVGVPVGLHRAVAAIAPDVARKPLFLLGLAAMVLLWGATALAAASRARRHPLAEPPISSVATNVGYSLLTPVLAVLMYWGTALTGGLGAALFIVAYIEPLRTGQPGPELAAQIETLLGSLRWAVVGVVVHGLVSFGVLSLTRWIVQRRVRAVAVGR